ncbi:MAG: diphthamide biosynthesis enzyme Dph2 [Nanoarchaeota archaeon]|nr:diphthamide biosynthesis enzyme Dph2 [Nanoarchaeota archaeon]
MYDIELDKAIMEIGKIKPNLILIQLPEGLKKQAIELSQKIEKETGANTIISGEPCWGACDIAEQEAKELKADLILHFGHNEFTRTSIKTIYVPVKYKEQIKIKKDQFQKLDKFRSIMILASAQYTNQVEKIKKQIGEKAKTFVSPLILGCKVPTINTDAAIVIGNQFHALGAALKTEKPVFLLDKEGNLKDMKRLKLQTLSNNLHKIHEFRDAHNIGIIISTKPGQKQLELAQKIKQELEADQKNAVIISLKEITNTQLNNFYTIEAFINTACPRLSTDNTQEFDKPLIHYTDLE